MVEFRLRRTLIAMLALGPLAACGRRKAHDPLAAGAKVIALGDSLTYGTGAASVQSYPTVLASLTGWNIENAGAPGETSEQICARLPDLLARHRPALVLVLAGGNDFLRRMPASGVRTALAACAEHARAASVPLALLPVPRLGLGGLSNDPLYAESAASLGVPLVDAGLDEWLATPAMRADAVHLNAAGYRAMAGRIADGLAQLGWLRR